MWPIHMLHNHIWARVVRWENNVHRLYCCHNRNVCLCAHGQNLSKHKILIYVKVINEAKRSKTMWFGRKCVSDILRAYQNEKQVTWTIKNFILCFFFFLLRPDTSKSILFSLKHVFHRMFIHILNFTLCWREIKQMLLTESCPKLLINH